MMVMRILMAMVMVMINIHQCHQHPHHHQRSHHHHHHSHLAEIFVVQVELHNSPRRCKRPALSAHHPSGGHNFEIYHRSFKSLALWLSSPPSSSFESSSSSQSSSSSRVAQRSSPMQKTHSQCSSPFGSFGIYHPFQILKITVIIINLV